MQEKVQKAFPGTTVRSALGQIDPQSNKIVFYTDLHIPVVDIEANKENLVISCWSNQVIEIITENGTIRQEIPVTSKIGMLDEGNKSAMAGYLTLHQGNVFYSSPALGLFKFPLSLVKGGALKWTKLMGVLICPYSAIR